MAQQLQVHDDHAGYRELEQTCNASLGNFHDFPEKNVLREVDGDIDENYDNVEEHHSEPLLDTPQ